MSHSLAKQKNHDILVDLSMSLKKLQLDLDEIKADISFIRNDIRVQKIKDMVEKPLPKDEEPEQSGWRWRS